MVDVLTLLCFFGAALREDGEFRIALSVDDGLVVESLVVGLYSGGKLGGVSEVWKSGRV